MQLRLSQQRLPGLEVWKDVFYGGISYFRTEKEQGYFPCDVDDALTVGVDDFKVGTYSS